MLMHMNRWRLQPFERQIAAHPANLASACSKVTRLKESVEIGNRRLTDAPLALLFVEREFNAYLSRCDI